MLQVPCGSGGAWGNGEIFLNYRCTPVTPIDRYRSGYKTNILISRRKVKNKVDVDEFNIEWGIRQRFRQQAEQWETHVAHRTKRLKIEVVFPGSRPPRFPILIEGNHQRSHDLGRELRDCQMTAGASRGRRTDLAGTRTTSCNGSGKKR